MSYRVQVGLLLALAGITFVLWGVHYAHIDLWWDELDSLTEYALVTFQTTVTKYPYPNNHIFFNLFDNGLTRVWGVRDIYQIMERVAFLRWAQWLISAGTLAYTFFAARRVRGSRVGALAAVLLVTSLPFLNFAMQLRGYGLSMFFVAGLLFHCALRRERVSLVSALVTAVFSFALLYTVPSNVYFLFVLGLALVVREVGTLRRRRLASIRSEDATDRDANRAGGKIPGWMRGWIRDADVWSAAAVAVGAVAAFVAYLPVLDNVLNNRFVTDTPDHRFFVLTRRLPEIASHFLSSRYGLLLLVLPGLFWVLRSGPVGLSHPADGDEPSGSRRGDDASGRDRGTSPRAQDRVPPIASRSPRGTGRADLVMVLALFLGPFLASFAHNDVPFQRTFIHLAPVFGILLAFSVDGCHRWLEVRTPVVVRWLPLGVAIYCVVTLGYVHQRVEQRLEADLDQNIREQNIFANYYQAPGFRPLDTCRALAAQVAAHPGTVVLANELDRVSWTFYLQKFDIPSYALAQFKEDNTSGATHTGVFQLARGRDGERVFLQWSMRIPEPFDSGDRLTPVMLYLASYDPADVIYVVTGLNRLIEQVVTTRYPEFRMERLEVPGSYGVFRLTRRS